VDGQILDLGARLGAQAAGSLNLQGGA